MGNINNISEQKLKPFRKKQYNILGDRPFEVVSSIQKIAIPEDVILDKDMLEENNEIQCYTSETTTEEDDNDNQSQYLKMEESVDAIVSYNIFEQTIVIEEQSDSSITPSSYTVSLKIKLKLLQLKKTILYYFIFMYLLINEIKTSRMIFVISTLIMSVL